MGFSWCFVEVENIVKIIVEICNIFLNIDKKGVVRVLIDICERF